MKVVVTKVLQIGTFIGSIGFIGSTIIQIYARFFLSSAPSWTEEAARFFFVYAMSFAAGLAMKDNEFVSLDIIYDRLNDTSKRILNVIISLSILMLFVIMLIYSVQYTALGVAERSPSLRLPMAFAFMSIVIMSLSIAFYSIDDLLKYSKNK